MIRNDCHGCTERNEECHATCEKYRAYVAENEKRRKWLKRMNDGDPGKSTIRYNRISRRFEVPERGINRRERTKKGR